MRNGMLNIVGGFGLLAVLGGSYATSDIAPWTRTLRAILVKNVDERGRNPYMEFEALVCPGGGALTCEVVFPPVPAGHRLVLERVNASINFAPGGVRRTALLTPGEMVQVFPAAPISDPDLLIVNESTLVYYDGGESPIFQIAIDESNDDPFITVAVSGYLVDLGQ